MWIVILVYSAGLPEPHILKSILSTSTLGFLVEEGKNHGKSWSNELQNEISAINGSE
jgi:hypothetical protein